MTRRDWEGAVGSRLGVFLNGDELRQPTRQGKPVRDDSSIVLFNAEYEPVEFTLPPRRFGTRWLLELSTADPAAAATEPAARATIAIEGRSLIVLRRRT